MKTAKKAAKKVKMLKKKAAKKAKKAKKASKKADKKAKKASKKADKKAKKASKKQTAKKAAKKVKTLKKKTAKKAAKKVTVIRSKKVAPRPLAPVKVSLLKKLPAKLTTIRPAVKTVAINTKILKTAQAPLPKTGLDAQALLKSGITLRKTKRNGPNGRPDYLMVYVTQKYSADQLKALSKVIMDKD